jgi:hypothetical protein
MDLKHECEFLYRLNPLPEWGKTGEILKRVGTGEMRFYPIGNGVK